MIDNGDLTETVQTIKISQVIVERDLQARVELDEETIAEYARLLESGEEFPPVDVTLDGHHRYWLYDGFHRIRAHIRAGRQMIRVRTTAGSRDEAAWKAVAMNQKHGLKRSNADKRRSVELALKMRPEFSDRAIAEHVGVDHKTVGDVRKDPTGEFPQLDERVGKDGKVRRVPVPNEKVSGQLEDSSSCDEITALTVPSEPQVATVASSHGKAADSGTAALPKPAPRSGKAKDATPDVALLARQLGEAHELLCNLVTSDQPHPAAFQQDAHDLLVRHGADCSREESG